MGLVNFRAQSSFRAGDWSRVVSKILPRVVAAVTAASEAVLNVSRQYCPVRSGALVASGGTQVSILGEKVVGFVYYTAGHASFVEFGTGLTGSGTYPYALPEQGVPFTGSWVYDYKTQGWIGMTAQPYLRPALDEHDLILAAWRDQGFSF
jgi:hypothetical protein